MVIAVIILYVGISSFIEAIKKIINPVKPSYTFITIIVVSISVIVKIVLAKYFNKVGKDLKSDSLTNSGQDAKLDAFVSLSILL